jgi:hypothetical protein
MLRVANKPIMLSVVMLSVVMPSVVMPSVVMLGVVMLGVATPQKYLKLFSKTNQTFKNLARGKKISKR